MTVFLSSFYLPKAGNTEKEYEDAFAPSKVGERNGDILRFAVADGSTEGMLSGEWAEILVKVFSRSKEHSIDHKDILAKAHKGWDKFQKNYLERRKRCKPIQWYEETGLQRGAFSTFLGLTLSKSKKQFGRWQAVVLGDTCLFQVRRESLIAQIPLTQSSEFNNRPFLVPSKDTNAEEVLNAVKVFEGDYQGNDCFYLMTDALACWFLQEYEEGNKPWKVPRDLSTDIDKGQEEFKEWLSQLRENKLIHNDDVTMVRIDIF